MDGRECPSSSPTAEGSRSISSKSHVFHHGRTISISWWIRVKYVDSEIPGYGNEDGWTLSHDCWCASSSDLEFTFHITIPNWDTEDVGDERTGYGQWGSASGARTGS